MRLHLAFAALLVMTWVQSVSAQTPTSYSLIDATGKPFSPAGFNCLSSKLCPASVSSDASGNPLSGIAGTTNPNGTAAYIQGVLGGVPVPILSSGSAGLDFSGSLKPVLPNVGAAFAASGPYASYVLIATVPASPTRNNVDIENITGAQIAIIRDDGTATNGAAPNNASIFSLGGGSGSGAQGGSWSNATFKGRLQIYAPTSTTIAPAVMVD
jgi:hypothetical protein